MDDILNQTTPVALRLDTLAINLLLALVVGTVIAWFYTQFGRSLSNRSRFAQNLPALAVITVLIISIVQSSLALSLGLVGALSIVRFRTAIKEPEELIYLFLAIAIGLGMGANQRLPTLLATAIILLYLYLPTLINRRKEKSTLYLNVNIESDNVDFAAIERMIMEHSESAELRRFDSSAALFHVAYALQSTNSESLSALTTVLRQSYKNADISFIEAENLLTA